MNSVESAINLGVMSDEQGVQFIYDLANSKVSQEEKIGVLKSHIAEYIFNVLEYGAYHLEDDANEDTEHSAKFLNYEFLNIVFGSILHTVNWDVIINYHKEH